MTAGDMEQFWDARAREDAAYFVDNLLVYGEGGSEEFWSRGEDVVADILGRLGIEFAADDRVVEVGCGIGRLTRVIAERVERVWAFDISSEMLTRAREENPQLRNVEWVHGDGTSLQPLEDASATACFSFVVFQHLPDPAITLRYVAEMGRVLRVGGWSAFQISNDPTIHRPHRTTLRTRVKTLLGRAPRGQDNPAWLGSAVELADLEAAASAAGLTVERVVGPGTQFCLVLLRRVER